MTLGMGSYCQTLDTRESILCGNYTSIASGVYFHEKNDNHQCAKNKKCVYTTNWDQIEAEEIVIGHDVWIGQGARILPGVKIGNGAVIGAGAVVSRDVLPYAVMVGNTARRTRFRFTSWQIKKLEKIKWWEWDEEKVGQRREDMLDIDVFLKKYG